MIPSSRTRTPHRYPVQAEMVISYYEPNRSKQSQRTSSSLLSSFGTFAIVGFGEDARLRAPLRLPDILQASVQAGQEQGLDEKDLRRYIA